MDNIVIFSAEIHKKKKWIYIIIYYQSNIVQKATMPGIDIITMSRPFTIIKLNVSSVQEYTCRNQRVKMISNLIFLDK